MHCREIELSSIFFPRHAVVLSKWTESIWHNKQADLGEATGKREGAWQGILEWLKHQSAMATSKSARMQPFALLQPGSKIPVWWPFG